MSELRSYFETRTRDNGESFVCLLDSAPEWLRDAVHDAHNGDGPHDWIYCECRDACEAIDHGDLTDDDSVHQYADGRVDMYTRDLYQWAADMCLSDTYSHAQSSADDCGDTSTDEKRISVLQYSAIESIARTVLDACLEHASDE